MTRISISIRFRRFSLAIGNRQLFNPSRKPRQQGSSCNPTAVPDLLVVLLSENRRRHLATHQHVGREARSDRQRRPSTGDDSARSHLQVAVACSIPWQYRLTRANSRSPSTAVGPTFYPSFVASADLLKSTHSRSLTSRAVLNFTCPPETTYVLPTSAWHMECLFLLCLVLAAA